MHQLLTLLAKNEVYLTSNPAELLHALRPSDHSLGFLFVLWAWSRSSAFSPLGDPEFVELGCTFLIECSTWQVRVAPGELVVVCRMVRDQVVALKVPRRGSDHW